MNTGREKLKKNVCIIYIVCHMNTVCDMNMWLTKQKLWSVISPYEYLSPKTLTSSVFCLQNTHFAVFPSNESYSGAAISPNNFQQSMFTSDVYNFTNKKLVDKTLARHWMWGYENYFRTFYIFISAKILNYFACVLKHYSFKYQTFLLF